MEKYINVLRCILKNFNIDNIHESDNIIKYIINKIFDEYYNNRHKNVYCIDNLYKKYHTHECFILERKYHIINNEELIFKFNKLVLDNFKIILNKNLYIAYMENYVNVLRCILKNFNVRKNNEFDNIIKYIINKIFDEY